MGGHSCTVDAPIPGGTCAVDVGFIVFNERNYPNLVALLDHLGVPTETSDMSFAVSLDKGRFEYGSSFASFLAHDFTIGNFIDEARFSPAFRDRYLVPMAACIWSTPLNHTLDYPAQTFVRFFNNHGLLAVGSQLAGAR